MHVNVYIYIFIYTYVYIYTHIGVCLENTNNGYIDQLIHCGILRYVFFRNVEGVFNGYILRFSDPFKIGPAAVRRIVHDVTAHLLRQVGGAGLPSRRMLHLLRG